MATFEFKENGIIVDLGPVKPFVGDDGIYTPSPYDQRCYQCLITKELFVEAYNKWIKPQNRGSAKFGEDTADDWCE
jgi:hypothetical protein